MKTIKKNVYYCDHCKKKSLSAGTLAKHEKHCTGNPNRECRMCDGRDIVGIVANLKTRFVIKDYERWQLEEIPGPEFTRYIEWVGEPVTLNEIKKLADDCPCCTLAILRQTQLNYGCCKLEPFDFKEELGLALIRKNDEQVLNQMY